MDHIVREIRKSLLIRDLGDFCRQAAEIRFLLDQESGASYFRSCTGSFHSGRSSADYHDITRFVDLMFLIIFTLGNRRIDRTADRAVDPDSISGTSDVAGDAFADVTDIAEFYFVHPFRISDQSAADSDQVSIASGENILCDMRIADISHCDTGLVVFFLYSFCHISTPSVREVVGVDLILDRAVQTTGNVDDVSFFLDVLKIFKAVV